MQDTDLPEKPFFDPAALRTELTAVFKAGNSAEACRPQVLARLKELLAGAHDGARARIAVTANGIDCASSLSRVSRRAHSADLRLHGRPHLSRDHQWQQ